MASSQLEIINGAALLIGETKLTGLTDQRLLAETGNLTYEATLKKCLGNNPWRFAMKKVALSQLVTGPINEWKYAYQLPGDLCRLERVYPDGLYDIYGDQVYSNSSSLDCDYVARNGAEDVMPPHFADLMMHEVAVKIVAIITNSDTAAQKLEQWRILAYNRAVATDAQQRPNQAFRSNPFSDVRRRGTR